MKTVKPVTLGRALSGETFPAGTAVKVIPEKNLRRLVGSGEARALKECRGRMLSKGEAVFYVKIAAYVCCLFRSDLYDD